MHKHLPLLFRIILGSTAWIPTGTTAPLTQAQIDEINGRGNQYTPTIHRNFDPQKVQAIVVGCDPTQHCVHFLDGRYFPHIQDAKVLYVDEWQQKRACDGVELVLDSVRHTN